MDLEKDSQTKLLETATTLFAQKGFNGVSVRQLAEAANVNIAAISYYFRGKEGLYQAVLEEQFAPIAAALSQTKTANKLSATEQLSMYAKHIAIIHRQRPLFTRFIFNEVSNPTPFFDLIFKKYISKIFQFITGALTKGIADGDFAADLNINHAALSLAGIMNFYFIVNPLAKTIMPLDNTSDAEEYTVQAYRIYLDGIRRKKDE
ncbi:MAG: transcriptional regulator, TetR family [Firmicutes bacterium]|nr:transcriptional regulator, TetR family [Bacillota bacterium]